MKFPDDALVQVLDMETLRRSDDPMDSLAQMTDAMVRRIPEDGKRWRVRMIEDGASGLALYAHPIDSDPRVKITVSEDLHQINIKRRCDRAEVRASWSR